MKVTIEMDEKDFKEYEEMKKKVANPNLVDANTISITDFLLKRGFIKSDDEYNHDPITKNDVKMVTFKKHSIQDRSDIEVTMVMRARY